MLGILGLDELAERVYRELVHLGPCSVDALALRLGLSRRPVAEAVEVLEAKSLASRNALGQVHTAPPQLALGALLTAQRHALGQAELTAAALAEAYHAASAASQNAHDLVEVAVGTDQVRQRLEHIQLNAEFELLALVQARTEVVGAGSGDAETLAVQRGVRYRVVIERSILDGQQAVDDLAASVVGEVVRVTESVPTRLVVADRGTVMLPLSEPEASAEGDGRPGGDEGPMALISRAPGLVTAMLGLFESIWQRAVPVRLAGEDRAIPPESLPTALDLRILSLLLVGATDAAIAKQLGLGLRTVQRRVAHMMDLAEVSTRLQLGWQAHERGWLA